MGKKPKFKQHNTNLSNADRGIDAQLTKFNLRLFDVIGDGNCLFRALSHQMDSSQGNHSKYRVEITSHMRANPNLYAPFLDESESLDQRLRRMQKTGVYGDNIEIVAFSRAFNVAVVIHQDGQPPWIVDACGDDGNRDLGRQIVQIVYHSWEHYSSVIKENHDVTKSNPAVNPKSNQKRKIACITALSNQLSVEERIVLASIPKHLDADIETVKRLLSECENNIGQVVEAYVAQVYADDNYDTTENRNIYENFNPEHEFKSVEKTSETQADAIKNEISRVQSSYAPNTSKISRTTKNESKEFRNNKITKEIHQNSATKAKLPPRTAREKKEEKKKERKENALAKKRNKLPSEFPIKSEEISPKIEKEVNNGNKKLDFLESMSIITEGMNATFI
ncbi:OTU domain-containing protein 3 [Physocladia obscura]|uniref:OTU domain-containing protein 3 n=1 Tax=Physocladia obscura TaxID=109957 RepID=A0AAD5TBI4_9FUNG|nr:OTU domain-containing protein 3 [Physocladia obscura]